MEHLCSKLGGKTSARAKNYRKSFFFDEIKEPKPTYEPTKLLRDAFSSGWAVVERSPLIPEIRGSNPVIGKLLSYICLLSTVVKRRK